MVGTWLFFKGKSTAEPATALEQEPPAAIPGDVGHDEHMVIFQG